MRSTIRRPPIAWSPSCCRSRRKRRRSHNSLKWQNSARSKFVYKISTRFEKISWLLLGLFGTQIFCTLKNSVKIHKFMNSCDFTEFLVQIHTVRHMLLAKNCARSTLYIHDTQVDLSNWGARSPVPCSVVRTLHSSRPEIIGKKNPSWKKIWNIIYHQKDRLSLWFAVNNNN